MSLADRIEKLGVWTRSGQRAPHKPLLVLYALARIQLGKPHQVSFAEIEADLTPVLRWALPVRKSQLSYPFWNLQNDGIWQVTGTVGMQRRGGDKEPLLPLLRQPTVQGGFPEAYDTWLRQHPAEVVRLAHVLLEAHFPSTLHQDLCDQLGLSLEQPEVVARRPRRDPAFRGKVLLAYEYRCAVCGYDGRLDVTHIGLEAAHVRWHTAAGPDEVDNGMALCSLHHKMFDVGAFSLSPDHRVMVSDSFLGGSEAEFWILRHHGQSLVGPRVDKPKVAELHRSWHWEQVFRTPALRMLVRPI